MKIQEISLREDEAINNQGEEAAGRKWINTLIAAGAWLGSQKIQWEKLTDYQVHKLEPEIDEEGSTSQPFNWY